MEVEGLKTFLSVVPGELIRHSLKLILFHLFLVGNLGRVDHVTEFEYDLFIRPDTCNPRFRVWFNFTVENVKESQVSDNKLDGIIASKTSYSRTCLLNKKDDTLGLQLKISLKCIFVL